MTQDKDTGKVLQGSRYDIRIDRSGQTEEIQPPPLGERGWIHSYETGGTVDGPGVRFVLFLNGCSLRCQYCHNPDTWHMKDGQELGVDEVLAEIRKYRKFLKITGGGVTISGGEPLVQAPFLANILRGCKRMDLHTAVDTCGYLGARYTDAMLEDTDLILLDIKSWFPETYREVTGRELQPTLDFARRLADIGKPTWLRYVLVPGLTDDERNIEGLADFAAGLGVIERVEVLPFHKMGEEKWRALGLEYRLTETRPPEHNLVRRTQEQFRRRGLEVV